MKVTIAILFSFCSLAAIGQRHNNAKSDSNTEYFPPAFEWRHKSAEEMGFDTVKLYQAIGFAISHESANPRSMELDHEMTFGKEPYGESIGPFKDRGRP